MHPPVCVLSSSASCALACFPTASAVGDTDRLAVCLSALFCPFSFVQPPTSSVRHVVPVVCGPISARVAAGHAAATARASDHGQQRQPQQSQCRRRRLQILPVRVERAARRRRRRPIAGQREETRETQRSQRKQRKCSSSDSCGISERNGRSASGPRPRRRRLIRPSRWPVARRLRRPSAHAPPHAAATRARHSAHA